jgi:nucleotide-binding universal stress UspA family protein
MAKIIVAIDFSKGSMHALEYAIQFANNYKSNIIMVWVDDSVSPEALYSISSYDDRAEIKEHFNDIIKQKQEKLIGGKLSFKMKKGKVYHEINNLAKKENADLIIAGTHGVSGYEKFWIGSNAYRIVIYSPCPVITIKYGFGFSEKINNIVLPIDNSSETTQKVPYTVKLAKKFNSKVHILKLYSTHLKAIHKKVDSYADNAVKMLQNDKIKFVTETLQVDDIAHAAINYSKKNKADLIAIMTEQEKAKADILLGAYAQQMVYYSPFPVLSVRANQHNGD